MELREVRIDEVEKVLDMYEEVRTYTKINSIKKFCEDYLDRCECCGEICYYDSLQKMKNWKGQSMLCCENCAKEIEKDNVQDNEDNYNDNQYEEHILGII